MFVRVATGVALFAVGFLLGRELGRTESIRDELRQAREQSRRSGIGELAADKESRVASREGSGRSDDLPVGGRG